MNKELNWKIVGSKTRNNVKKLRILLLRIFFNLLIKKKTDK